MKVLKKIFTFLFSLIIFCILLVISVCMIAKNIFKNQIINNVAKEELVKKYTENANSDQVKQFKEILDDSDLSNIVDSVIDEFLNAIKEDNYEVSSETVDKIINFFIKNKDKIEKVTGSEINTSEINSEKSRAELTKSLNEALHEINGQLDSSVKIVINVYNYLTNALTLILLSLIVIVLTGIVMIINKSIYSGLNALAVPLIIVGLILLAIYTIINPFIKNVTLDGDIKINISISFILIYGLSNFILGVLALVIKGILRKENKKLQEV